jgi:DNA-binding response OmpR family regulator
MANRILLVDDEKGITDTLTAILQMKGYQVDVASDGAEGLDAACRIRPDLIISDIAMPKLNGVEMAIEIRKKISEAKILLISGQAVTIELLQEARTRGYQFEWLAKPVHPLDLLKKVKSMLDGA